MDKKKLLMAGGAGLAILLIIKHKSAAAAQAQAAQNNAPPLAMYSLPVSGGISSQDSAAAGSDLLGQLPAAATSTMSSPDMSGLLSSLLGQQATQNQAQILANQNTADSQALASLNLGANGGTATLTHSATGTTLTTTPTQHVPTPYSPAPRNQVPSDPTQAYIYQEYENLLGRAPDASGMASWTQHLQQGMSMGMVDYYIRHSPEYLSKHGG